MAQPGSQMQVVHPFTAEGEGELTVAANAILTVMEAETPSNAGWLLVRAQDGRTGYVPMDFLSAVATPQVEAESSFKQKAASRMSVAMPPAAVLQQQQQYGRDGSFHPSSSQQPPAAAAPPAWGVSSSTNQTNSGNAWAQRDSLFGSFVRTPIPPLRRWYYRDLFGDMQGPFNAQEMKQRVDARHIQPETFCVIEVGSGAAQQHEEKKLRELFPTLDVAFMQPPVIGGPKMFWYFLDDAKTEHGPFSADQMRLWLDAEGYFASTSLLRDAATSGSTYAPLAQFFPDPGTAFIIVASSPASSSTARAAVEEPSFQIFDPFQSTPRQTSSRHLLQAALAGGPPPAIGKSVQQPQQASITKQSSQSLDDEDDTLALFDKVSMMTEEESKKGSGVTGMAESKISLRIYGSPSVWGPWKGVPTFNGKPESFPTLLYQFVTRPLNPSAGKILCHITREIDGIGHFNFNKFVLYLENETGPQPTAIAFRHNGPMSTTFDIKLLTNGRVDDTKGALSIAKMEVNFMGTQFLLHNSVPGHQGKAKDLCCVLYEANRMGKGGPRRMRVGIPDIDEGKPEFKVFPHGGAGADSMLTSLQHINAKNLVPMLNKPPRWNEAKKAYSLDFGGRVTRASVKNFQLVDAIHDPEHSNVILQHGRVGQDKFTMDVQHPMSLLQAFAVCLSSLHQKKAVD